MRSAEQNTQTHNERRIDSKTSKEERSMATEADTHARTETVRERSVERTDDDDETREERSGRA